MRGKIGPVLCKSLTNALSQLFDGPGILDDPRCLKLRITAVVIEVVVAVDDHQRFVIQTFDTSEFSHGECNITDAHPGIVEDVFVATCN